MDLDKEIGVEMVGVMRHQPKISSNQGFLVAELPNLSIHGFSYNTCTCRSRAANSLLLSTEERKLHGPGLFRI